MPLSQDDVGLRIASACVRIEKRTLGNTAVFFARLNDFDRVVFREEVDATFANAIVFISFLMNGFLEIGVKA